MVYKGVGMRIVLMMGADGIASFMNSYLCLKVEV